MPNAQFKKERYFGLDGDTVAYIRLIFQNRGKLINPAEARDIDNFVRGVKSLGLWQNITECWFLSQSYNAGIGNTVYGIKNAFNGTIINNAIWKNEGIDFSPNNSVINHSYRFNSGTHTICSAIIGASAVNQTLARHIFRATNFGNNSHIWLRTGTVGGEINILNSIMGSDPTFRVNKNSTTNQSIATGVGGLFISVFATNNLTNDGGISSFGGFTGAIGYLEAVMSFHAIFNSTLSNTQCDLLQDLIKNTICKNSKLP